MSDQDEVLYQHTWYERLIARVMQRHWERQAGREYDRFIKQIIAKRTAQFAAQQDPPPHRA